jgi:hypothetical protein
LDGQVIEATWRLAWTRKIVANRIAAPIAFSLLAVEPTRL